MRPGRSLAFVALKQNLKQKFRYGKDWAELIAFLKARLNVELIKHDDNFRSKNLILTVLTRAQNHEIN